MRVSDAVFSKSFLQGLRSNRETLDRALRQLADGKRVRQASDDPSAARSSLALRARLVRLEGFQRAGQLARFDLASIESALSDTISGLSEAQTLAMQGASTTNEDSGPLLADTIDRIRDDLLDLANINVADRYLFGGTETQTEPFDAAGAYAGNSLEVRAPLDDTKTVAGTLSGRRAFVDGGDVFQTLEDLSVALRAGDTAAIEAAIPALDLQIDHVALVRSDIGNRLNRIDATATRQSDEALQIQTRIADLEGIDLERVIVDLTQANNSLDALSAGAARVLGRSLFDFLG